VGKAFRGRKRDLGLLPPYKVADLKIDYQMEWFPGNILTGKILKA